MNKKAQTGIIIGIIIGLIIALVILIKLGLVGAIWVEENVKGRLDDSTYENRFYLELNEEGEICDLLQLAVMVTDEVDFVRGCFPIISDPLGNIGNCAAQGASWDIELSCPSGKVACKKQTNKIPSEIKINVNEQTIFHTMNAPADQVSGAGYNFLTPDVCPVMNAACGERGNCKVYGRVYSAGGNYLMKVAPGASSHFTKDPVLADELGIKDKMGDLAETPPKIIVNPEQIEIFEGELISIPKKETDIIQQPQNIDGIDILPPIAEKSWWQIIKDWFALLGSKVRTIFT